MQLLKQTNSKRKSPDRKTGQDFFNNINLYLKDAIYKLCAYQKLGQYTPRR